MNLIIIIATIYLVITTAWWTIGTRICLSGPPNSRPTPKRRPR